MLDYGWLAELDARGLTIREIAAELGVSPAFVCRALKARLKTSLRNEVPSPAFAD